ncbi:MAG: substrate-binding domain-containing protein [Deltaproteobacteria bacterium]|nr:substrate-binding domain-containing protein [Deltaproteobacteria bacterium]
MKRNFLLASVIILALIASGYFFLASNTPQSNSSNTLVTALAADKKATKPKVIIQVPVAVAANFEKPMDALIIDFTSKYDDYEIVATYGATGDFLAQIQAQPVGQSPFALFLAANKAAPDALVTDGRASSTDETYANGALALISNTTGPAVGPSDATAISVLSNKSFTGKCVIANTEKAPYGGQSKVVLSRQEINTNNQYVVNTDPTQTCDPSLQMNCANIDVQPDIGTVYAKVGQNDPNFPIGFVALSEVCGRTDPKIWIVNPSFYSPLEQGMVTVKTNFGADTDAGATAFYNYLLNDSDAHTIILRYCYTLPQKHSVKK